MAYNPEYRSKTRFPLGSPDSKDDHFALAAKKGIAERKAALEEREKQARVDQLTLEFLSKLPNGGKFFKN